MLSVSGSLGTSTGMHAVSYAFLTFAWLWWVYFPVYWFTAVLCILVYMNPPSLLCPKLPSTLLIFFLLFLCYLCFVSFASYLARPILCIYCPNHSLPWPHYVRSLFPTPQHLFLPHGTKVTVFIWQTCGVFHFRFHISAFYFFFYVVVSNNTRHTRFFLTFLLLLLHRRNHQRRRFIHSIQYRIYSIVGLVYLYI